jgi:hypothetical protein
MYTRSAFDMTPTECHQYICDLRDIIDSLTSDIRFGEELADRVMQDIHTQWEMDHVLKDKPDALLEVYRAMLLKLEGDMKMLSAHPITNYTDNYEV